MNVDVYGDHGSYLSVQYLTGEDFFDPNKDIPIQLSVHNKKDECVLLSEISIAFDKGADLLPEGAQKNFTLPGTTEVPPRSIEKFTVDMRLPPDSLPGQYSIKMSATAGLCSDPSHRLSKIYGPGLDLRVPEKSASQCIIATATYGSELAPEVQFLRGFRDNMVLSTYSGSNFMILFNTFYYSWSPGVADVIRDDDGLKSISRIMITPLISILKTVSIIEQNELSVVASGMLSSILIGIVYIGPVIIAALFVLRRSVRKDHIKYMLIEWLIALGLTATANILHHDLFVMVSTGMLVLSSISFDASILAFIVSKRSIGRLVELTTRSRKS